MIINLNIYNDYLTTSIRNALKRTQEEILEVIV